jgi:hypothetical protein
MRRLRVLGSTTIAILAVAGLFAATASALEVGLLALAPLKAGLPFKSTSGAGTFSLPSGAKFECQKDKDDGTLGEPGQGDLSLGIILIDFEGCKESKGKTSVNCSTENAKGEKDAAGIILVIGDFHAIDVLKEGKLEAGAAIILTETLLINCSIMKAEMKGDVLGLLLAPSSSDVTMFVLDYLAGSEECDPEDKTCSKYKEEKLLTNLAGSFEATTFETTDEVTLEGTEGMVKVLA